MADPINWLKPAPGTTHHADSGASANRLEVMQTHVQHRTTALRSNGQPPAELLAHLVVALSRHLRRLRAEGGRVPAQLDELITFLTDPVRVVPHDATVCNPLRTRFDASATPRRLLITKSDAAEALCVSLRTIERLISAGRLPLVHVEGAARVRVTDLEAYVQGLQADGGPNS